MKKTVKVLIVDDSPVRRKVLEHILNQDDDIKVIGYAKSSVETLDFLKNHTPDIITMDINIPGGINGFELTKLIVDKNPIPVIIISAIRNNENKAEVADAMMKSGALYFIDSPPGPWNKDFDSAADNIIKHIKLLSSPEDYKSRKPDIILPEPLLPEKKSKLPLIIIGVSTGGPAILKEIISLLPTEFKVPIIIAQHISSGFDKLLVNQLNKTSNIPIKVVENREKIKSGNIYFAPALKITELINDEFVVLNPPKDFHGHLPSISVLLASAISYFDKNIVGIILTGMGDDGVNELKMLRENGGITIAQDQASSIVYGMPKQAIERGAAMHIMNPVQIADYIIKFDKKYI
jgi:two-component system, chemotaxis family, protein-glutamate methylesterase/glutaminase